jgi:2-polyprenyl-3-methyl-5-hydroxy-6-metoxy-1,4-benzoquinol methylase
MPSTPYDAIAAWYDAFVRSAAVAGDFVVQHLLQLVEDIHGQHICDLACGQGRVARALAQRGAQVIGVDSSSRLLAIASQYEATEPLGITYRLDDAQALTTLADACFDGVVCNLALMDIPQLDAVFRAVWRILRPMGWFVFSITHPCFEAPHASWRTAPDGSISREIGTYFTQEFWRSDNPQGVRGQVGAHHRMLATYMNTLIQAGFVLARMSEPQATGTAAAQVPGYQVTPAFLMVRCIKGASHPPDRS